MTLRVLASVAVVLLLASCSSTSADPTDQPTVFVTVTAAPPPIPPVTATLPPVTAAPTVQPGIVPNVVGVNHQLAQATMQAAGFSNLSEEDVTGAARRIDPDVEWVVVEQEPAPGTVPVRADATIILRSKKIGE